MSFLAAAAALSLTKHARADGVPLNLQVQLVGKLGSFDRNFASRAGSVAQILVLSKAGDGESSRVAANVGSGLSALREVGGIPAQVQVEPFADAAALAARCRSQKVALVYFATSMDAEVTAAATALAGVDVLTVGTTASFAGRGTVVAFDLEEGRPKIVVNLTRAKAQNVAFKAELLKLARIVG